MQKTTILFIILTIGMNQYSFATPKKSTDKLFNGGFFNSKHAELTLDYRITVPTAKNQPTAPQKKSTKSTSANIRQSIVKISKKYIGTPYKYGGNSPRGFDCSGFVGYVYKQKGYNLPRTSAAQYAQLSPVKSPRAGDLVFFRNGRGIGHVGLYIGNGKMIHAPSKGESVRIESIEKPNWQRRYAGARSLLPRDTMVAQAAPNHSHK